LRMYYPELPKYEYKLDLYEQLDFDDDASNQVQDRLL
jgi:hypothetical protein